jgi:hypothetical protein
LRRKKQEERKRREKYRETKANKEKRIGMVEKRGRREK